jgi:hypothetical protein
MNRLIPTAAGAGVLLALAALAGPVLAEDVKPYENCAAAYAAGRANIPKGDPYYADHLDGTGANEPDGMACEDPPAGWKPGTTVGPTTTTAPGATTTTKAPTGPTTTVPPVRATPRFTG